MEGKKNGFYVLSFGSKRINILVLAACTKLKY